MDQNKGMRKEGERDERSKGRNTGKDGRRRGGRNDEVREKREESGVRGRKTGSAWKRVKGRKNEGKIDTKK